MAKLVLPTFYCPNASCKASGEKEVGIQEPLIELPVDPNHVRLACPLCGQYVTQCDSCCALMADYPTKAKLEPYYTCLKCGCPNLYEESLRLVVLGLPRNRPFLYNAARLLQRCIAEERYKTIKKEEIESLEHVSSHNIRTLGYAFLKLPAFGQQEATSDPLTSRRKRLHSEVQSSPDDGSLPIEQGTKDAENVLSSRKAPFAGGDQDNFDHLSTDNASKLYLEEHLTLQTWTQELRVPITTMAPPLRSQLKVLDVKLCKESDQNSIQSMLREHRAYTFLKIHAVLLKTLIMSNSPLVSMNGAVSKPSHIIDSDWTLLERFLEHRPALLAAKANSSGAADSAHSSPSPTSSHPQSIASILTKCALPDTTKTSILGIFSARNAKTTAVSRKQSLPFMPLLLHVGKELQRLYDELRVLLGPHSADSVAVHDDEGVELAESAFSPALANSMNAKESLEQLKLSVLLLSNLYRSLAAVLL